MSMTSRHAISLIERLEQVDWDFPGYLPQRASSIHTLHWYPAIFFRGLVGTLLDIIGPPDAGAIFVDPFAGSGVAPIEAWLRGWCARGLDNNSYALAIARAKTQLVEARGDRAQGDALKAALIRWQPPIRQDLDDLEEGRRLELSRVFSESMLPQIFGLLAWIGSPDPEVDNWRGTLRVILSSLLHRPLSLYRDVNHSYVIDRSRAAPPTTPEPPALDAFVGALDSAFFAAFAAAREANDRIGTLPPAPQFRRGSATNPASVEELGPWRVSITSPPYFGMNDYVRSNYLTQLVDPLGDFSSEITEEIGPRRLRTSPRELDRYVEGLRAAFKSMRATAHSDAVLIVVMGQSNSRLATSSNVQRRALEAIVDVGFDLAWATTRRVRYRKINATPYRSEDLWVFTPAMAGLR